ncbi:hypothetical protein ACFO0N_04135 [Halobium salinum]|uniref:Uncharacterized protein n=1 Tax=Halobium salinum TaxID=1364940 RepID=A0ABD5P8E1_9EURY|nr:hypothetical protein [Halobium salinum]
MEEKPECHTTSTAPAQGRQERESWVSQSVDETADGSRLVIADLTTDDAWISMDADACPTVAEEV